MLPRNCIKTASISRTATPSGPFQARFAFLYTVSLHALTVFLAVVAGCGKASSGSVLRSGTPDEAAAKVLELYDTNKDGKIVTAELAASPGLRDGLPRIDSNRDKAIDLSEMTARFAAQ